MRWLFGLIILCLGLAACGGHGTAQAETIANRTLPMFPADPAAPPPAPPISPAPHPEQKPDGIPPDDNPPKSFSVLVFSKTGGFRHPSIAVGIAAIKQLAADHGFTVDSSEDASMFADATLGRYAVVVFLSTTGELLNDDQQAAFERYMMQNGGFVGIHAAADAEYQWRWYGDLVGAFFAGHPAPQQATVRIDDTAHPATKDIKSPWSRFDEWYNYSRNPRRDVHVLLSLDESSYKGGSMMADHPIAWCQAFGGGRAFYTGLGHTDESFREPRFLQHLVGGILYAAGAAMGDCARP